MLDGQARYYIERLAEEHVRLVNTTSLAAEDAAIAKIKFYRAKLNDMGIRYDEAERRWVVSETVRGQRSPRSGERIASLDAKKASHDWELHFHENGRELGKRVAVSTDHAMDLLGIIQSKHCNVDVWRDGQFVCTVFNNRT